MARILIVAGGQWQVPIIQKAKRLGHYIINTNLFKNSPGFRYADQSYVVDVLDKDRNLEIARNHAVDAVLTDQSDIAVRTVAFVSEQLGLPSIGVEKAELFTNKLRMRQFCEAHSFGHPQYALCRTTDDIASFLKAIGPPIIIKPIDNQGSRGVQKIWSPDQIPAKLERTLEFSRDGSVLAEQFIFGTEFTAEGFCLGGRHATLAVSKKAHFRNNSAIANKLFYSLDDAEFDYGKLKSLNNNLVNKMGLPFGMTHAEYKYFQGKFYLIEIAARGGGTLISSHIVPLMSGVDTNELLIRCSTGEDVELPKAKPRSKYCILEFFEFKCGKVQKIVGLKKARTISGVIDIALSFKAGDLLAPPTDDKSRPGYFIAIANSKKELRDLAQYIKREIHVEYA